MTLRCTEGDLAFITHGDTPCANGIDRLVLVWGPIRFDETMGAVWQVYPAVAGPWVHNNPYAGRLSCSDAALLPLRVEKGRESELSAVLQDMLLETI